eukprot:gnl/TRDRNA2_/TRDRNA2_57115_c1_seq1.p1 gnl/TRDRNA2_/TRDRNA2_57115_c1~~gnl/TRDRNA2_/TRDRNA2_57115_c1_seq1.p1  ORF type:complete len:423 (+),score=55.14 gnl/TRDRNA2_/TRDRNA2_57115_c1_seq1:48-1271(+)
MAAGGSDGNNILKLPEAPCATNTGEDCGQAMMSTASVMVALGKAVQSLPMVFQLSAPANTIEQIVTRMPLGIVFEANEKGKIVVDGVDEGGKAYRAGVRVGDILRATTCVHADCTDSMQGVECSSKRKAVFTVDGASVSKVMQEIHSNDDFDGVVTLVLERPAAGGQVLRTQSRLRAVLPSSTFSGGWAWVASNSCDENYLDLAFLLSRGCTVQPQVGCIIVRGIEDGTQSRQQGRIIASGINSGLTQFKRYGVTRGKFGRQGPDCHAEAIAVAECAMLGVPLLGASCYVTMPPCVHCYTCLAAAGIREIILPVPMKSRPGGQHQESSAADLGIAIRVVPCSAERIAQREKLTAAHINRTLVHELRALRKLTRAEIKAANLKRLASGGNLSFSKTLALDTQEEGISA